MVISKHRSFCTVAFRVCAWKACGQVFVTFPRLRRKYCSDLCAATSYASRHTNRYTVRGALKQIQSCRLLKQARAETARQPVVRTPAPSNPVVNRHVPGSIAYMLLYGGGMSFSFNTHDGGEKVTCGGAARVGQVGGPNL